MERFGESGSEQTLDGLRESWPPNDASNLYSTSAWAEEDPQIDDMRRKLTIEDDLPDPVLGRDLGPKLWITRDF